MATGVGGLGAGDALGSLQTNLAQFQQMMQGVQQFSAATTAINVMTNTALSTDGQVKDVVNGAVNQAAEYNKKMGQNVQQFARS